MTHTLAFALTLQRSFDSAPLAGASFYAGGTPLTPVEKPNGLYVFTGMPVCSVRAEAKGMLPASVEPAHGQCTPVCMYEGAGHAASYGCITAEYAAAPHERLYISPPVDGLRVTESLTGTARLAVRRAAPVGGWLLFKGGDGREEPAFILEKQAPDKYYLLGHSGGFAGGLASRIYVGKADENGVCRIVLPQEFAGLAPDTLG